MKIKFITKNNSLKGICLIDTKNSELDYLIDITLLGFKKIVEGHFHEILNVDEVCNRLTFDITINLVDSDFNMTLFHTILNGTIDNIVNVDYEILKNQLEKNYKKTIDEYNPEMVLSISIDIYFI